MCYMYRWYPRNTKGDIMKTSLFVLAAVGVLGLAVPGLPAAQTACDGAFWQNASPAIKGFYVQGVLSGVLFGQARKGLPQP